MIGLFSVLIYGRLILALALMWKYWLSGVRFQDNILSLVRSDYRVNLLVNILGL